MKMMATHLLRMTALLSLSCLTSARVLLGSFVELDHDLAGQVYALSETVLEIENYEYDGRGPAAFFWLDTNSNPSRNGIVAQDGAPSNACAVTTDRSAKLPEARGITQRVEFPPGTSIRDYLGGSLSVWCEAANANFGHIVFPDTLPAGIPASGIARDCPVNTRVLLGNFVGLTHDVAGQVYALSETVLEVDNYSYDGGGPAAYFWLGTNSNPSSNGIIAPDGAPSNACALSTFDAKLPEARDVTQRIEFPPGTSIRDYLGGSLSVWCESANANFGHMVFPDTLPAGIPTEGVERQCPTERPFVETPPGFNCEELTDSYQVRWRVDEPNDQVTIQLIGSIKDNNYMGFGISGRTTETWMIGADAVVADWPGASADNPRVRDIYMDDRGQCSGEQGVCLDTTLNGIGTNDITNVSGMKGRGLTMIEYTRPLARTNTEQTPRNVPIDQAIDTSTGVSTFVVWAIGAISDTSGNPLIHSQRSDGGANSISLEFGRTTANNCEPLLAAGETLAPTPAPPAPFVREDVGDKDLNITARIGPSGGPRGYTAITGKTSWGIAWYLNDMLIPRVILRRGKTYTFKVNGGDTPGIDTKYHPLYITDSAQGGYAQQTAMQRLDETIYAGINITASSTELGVTEFVAEAEAPLCEYDETTPDSRNAELESFATYFGTLDTSCANDSSIVDNAAILTFTPDETTPDKLYYHCVTHYDLGFEILVLDVGEAIPTMSPTASPTTAAPTATPPETPANFIEVLLTGNLDGSIMRYKVNLADERAEGKNTLSVEVEAPATAWVGFAVSNTGTMVGSESIIGLPDTGEVQKYTMTSQSTAGVQPRDAAQQTLIDTSISQSGSITTLRFTKIMVEDGEIPINIETPNTFLSAWGFGNSLNTHSQRGSFALSNLEGGSVSNIETREKDLWKLHGWFAGIAWGVLCPLAIGASMLRRFIPGQGVWFNIHRTLNMLVVIFTIIAFSIAVAAINKETPSGFDANHFNSDPNPHRLVGLVVFIVAVAQAINGILRPHPPAQPDSSNAAGQDNNEMDTEEQPSGKSGNDDYKMENGVLVEQQAEEKSGARFGWEIGHRFLGVACLAMAWYQIDAGISIYNDLFSEENDLHAIFWGVVGGLTGVVVIGFIAAKSLPDN